MYSVGHRFKSRNLACEIRAIVDDMYVVQLFDQNNKTSTYRLWTRKYLSSLEDSNRNRINYSSRNQLIYDSYKAGQTLTSLGKRFSLSATRIRAICDQLDQKERKIRDAD